MVRRTTEGTGSGSAAYQRIAQREEAARAAMNDRIEGALDHIISELGDIRGDVRRLEQGSHTLTNRIADVERQIIDTRDEVQRRAITPAPSQIASARKAIEDKLKTWQARVTLWTAGAALASILASQIPDVARFVDRFLDFLQGKEVSAVDVVIPKKDEGQT